MTDADSIEQAMGRRLAASIPAGPHRMTVGLRPLDPAHWIEDAPDHAAQLREKRRVLASRDDVLACEAGAEPAVREAVNLLIEHLPRHLPQHYRVHDGRLDYDGFSLRVDRGLEAADGLATAAALVPEDLCLMREDGDGRYRLCAAALCFPTRWRLHDKLGKPMAAIHAPVPGYAGSIADATDRLLASLAADRPMWRQNWSLLDSPALYQPVRVAIDAPPEPSDPGRSLWLRSERQTLRRLPDSGAVLFTIRIRQCRLDTLCAIPGVAARLLQQLRTMPAALKRYKAIEEMEPFLLAWLDRQAARHPAPA